MTNPSKRKGNRIEREIVELHVDMGWNAHRVPLSGAIGGAYAGDLRIDGLGSGEVKARANGQGFSTIEKWLGQNDVLFLRRDRAEPLVIMPWKTYAKLRPTTKTG